MVIGETFAWGHLPKTAGGATLTLFRLFPELIVHADDHDSNEKHASFCHRLSQVAGKRLILNIRRLPAWNLSHAMHEATAGLAPEYRPLPMPTADEIAERTLADQTIAWFTGQGQLAIDRWLRAEHLERDFLALVTELTKVPDARRAAILDIGIVNAHRYDHDIGHWFTARHIRQMYERNPTWGAIEAQVYGDTVADRLDAVEARR